MVWELKIADFYVLTCLNICRKCQTKKLWMIGSSYAIIIFNNMLKKWSNNWLSNFVILIVTAV